MKLSRITKITLLNAIVCSTITHGFDLTGSSFFNPRSQSTDAVRDLVGWHTLINKYDQQGNLYGAAAVTPSYGQILRQKRAAQAMFGTDKLYISGSLVPNRGPNDILADYFGLSPAFQSGVLLKPFVQTAQLDFAAYVGWDNFYFRIHAPFVWTRWKLGMDEEVFADGKLIPFPPHYMSDTAVYAPVHSFSRAVQGGVTFGDVTQGLHYGKFNVSRALTGLSDIQMALGWNIVNSFRGYAGISLRVCAPTGSRPNSQFLFEPIVGNGKHWEFGAGFNGRVLLWEKDGNQELSFFADANLMHLCRTRQHRSFDLKINGFGSRYILAKEFDDTGSYTRNSLPLINVTTLPVDVRNAFQLDFVLMFGYTYKNLVLDLGYNIWLRSADIIDLKGCIPAKKYGLKGIQNVTSLLGTPLDTTQTLKSTLHGNNLSEQGDVVDPNSPLFIKTSNIDIQSAEAPFNLTQKIFAHLGWIGNDYCSNYTPFFGIGSDFEVEGINQRDQGRPSKNTLSQWNLWIKGGVGF